MDKWHVQTGKMNGANNNNDHGSGEKWGRSDETGDQVNKSVALQLVVRSKYFIDGIYGMNSSKSISGEFICRPFPFHFPLFFAQNIYKESAEFNSIA